MFGKKEPEPMAATAPTPQRNYDLEKRVIGVEADLRALYKHLGIERVRITTTEEVLTGLHKLATEVREEMRKVPKEK